MLLHPTLNARNNLEFSPLDSIIHSKIISQEKLPSNVQQTNKVAVNDTEYFPLSYVGTLKLSNSLTTFQTKF